MTTREEKRQADRIAATQGAILIATGGPEHPDCTMHQNKKEGRFIFTSPTTGTHTIHETEINDRVKAHWTGFLRNQERSKS